MSPLPTQMRDRWASRVEPGAGPGTVYWHVLMTRYPEAQAAATAAQDVLRGLPGFHLTPEAWLHMTLFIAGSTEHIGTPDRLAEMTTNVRAAVHDIEPIDVTVTRVLYHPEAVMLAVEPVGRLRRLRDVVLDATATTVGDLDTLPSSTWVPHMTVAYSTAGQAAAPVIGALGKSVPEQRFVIDSFSLVVQWGPERRWNWESVDVVELRQDAPHLAALVAESLNIEPSFQAVMRASLM
ncbi:MAG: 2'-5' RNA ligase family protein [Actinomycetota bacterium]|nr:2'-5' RNA ligase family protein [Actinomycetota bacterium]